MARLGIGDLPRPRKRWHIAYLPAPPPNVMGAERRAFECFTAALAEDQLRARSAQKAQSELFSRRAVRRLARKLRRRTTPRSLASSRWWRRNRIRIVGALWKLIERGPWDHRQPGQVALVSIVPRCWEFTPEQLNATDGHRLIAQLRTWLNRKGAGEAEGFLLACLHGEWVPTPGVYRVHAHGVAAGEMIAVIDALRTRPEFKPDRAPANGLMEPARVVISRKPITYLASAIAYQFKSYWPSRWVGVVDSGEVKRARRGQRIPEPQHTELLLWLDRHRLRNITLLMNLRVGLQGLELTRQPRNGAT